MKNFPIGASTLVSIVANHCYYVDKTPFVKQMVDSGRYYFLSRPRRFGKSLFLDTLKQAFLGKKQYFKGLFLENHWEWETRYPVIHISFGGGVIDSRELLDKSIHALIRENARTYQVTVTEETLHFQFKELIQKLHEQSQQTVVILIDEYDKPILDNITHPERAMEIREGLKNLYSVIKDCDALLKFVFLTGVSKFSKVSLFSGLNNLEDITLISEYATICGYTETELRDTFEERLEGVDFEQLRVWYNGYNFLGKSVYNPFDILLYLKEKIFKNYWFETGAPSFLIKLIHERKYFVPELENIKTTESLLSSFDVDRIPLETLLFQTGYLTISSTKKMGAREIFSLSYPNLEVKMSLTDVILQYLTDEISSKENHKNALYDALFSANLEQLQQTFHALFASIPYHWYINNKMDAYEGYYASIFYCYFSALGVEVRAEDSTNHGRIDLTVQVGDNIFIIEFKVIELDQQLHNALEQIKTKRYFEKYRFLPQRQIYLIGVEFSREERNVVNFEWEQIKSEGLL
ncbi:ATP-binding protein [Deltaproteobacteria bacterium TL4]